MKHIYTLSSIIILSFFIFSCAPQYSQYSPEEIAGLSELLVIDGNTDVSSQDMTGFAHKSRRIRFISCFDSDDGKDFYDAGSVSVDYRYKGIKKQKTLHDVCKNSKKLKEYFCKNKRLAKTTKRCPNGCSAGQCITADYCGDNVCNADEACNTCPTDCGTCLTVQDYDLSDYPDMFMHNMTFDGLLVIGSDAPATDTLAIANIALGLQKRSQYQIPSTVNKFDYEVSDLFGVNLISVGLPCNNNITANLMHNGDCDVGLGFDEALVSLYRNNGKYQLIFYGGSENASVIASHMMQYPDKLNWTGNTMLIHLS